MKADETIHKFIPEGDKTYDLGEIRCRLDNKTAILVPTDKRLMICKNGWLWFNKEVDEHGWGKFDHAKVSRKWGKFSIELKLRGGKGILKLERFESENFEPFYRRLQERISKYDEKYKISSKICPQCGETINHVARQCPHCRHIF